MKALITGATSGIGREFAVLLARMGCELILASRKTKKMEQLKRRLPVPVRVITADLSREADCLRLYEAVKDEFIIDEALVKKFKEDAIILHPLPRVNEITVGVDQYPGAAYFRQVGNGVPVRMALLALVTGSVK